MRSRWGREDGAAAVEFALIVGVLAMLIFGMLEFGVAFFQTQNLRAAAREGGRVAAVRGDVPEIGARMVDAAAGSLPVGFSGFDVVGGRCTQARAGQQVTVRIRNSQLPPNVQQALTINAPFLPTYTLNPDLSGTFRCE
jgi:hypothetical protein